MEKLPTGRDAELTRYLQERDELKRLLQDMRKGVAKVQRRSPFVDDSIPRRRKLESRLAQLDKIIGSKKESTPIA